MIKLFEFSQFIDGKNNICSKNFDFNKKYFCVVDCPSKVIIYDVSSMMISFISRRFMKILNILRKI